VCVRVCVQDDTWNSQLATEVLLIFNGISVKKTSVMAAIKSKYHNHLDLENDLCAAALLIQLRKCQLLTKKQAHPPYPLSKYC
jgi:hypothetical protein